MKSPAFSLYVRDWLCSKTVTKLHSKSYSKDANGCGSNLYSRGVAAYLYLLCEAWLETPRGTLPDDDLELASLARVSVEEWAALKSILMVQFQPLTDKQFPGRIFNERLVFESNKQLIRSKSGSKGGSKKQANRVAAPEDANANEIEDVIGTSEGDARGCSRPNENCQRNPAHVAPFPTAVSIYEIYPKKVGRPKALASIERQMADTCPQCLFELTAAYAKQRAGNEDCVPSVPHPTTWFNQQRFNDAPNTWGPNQDQQPQKTFTTMNTQHHLPNPHV